MEKSIQRIFIFAEWKQGLTLVNILALKVLPIHSSQFIHSFFTEYNQ